MQGLCTVMAGDQPSLEDPDFGIATSNGQGYQEIQL
jgi:hypothetical protein